MSVSTGAKRGEPVVTVVDDGSAAARGGVVVGSILLMVDTQDVSQRGHHAALDAILDARRRGVPHVSLLLQRPAPGGAWEKLLDPRAASPTSTLTRTSSGTLWTGEGVWCSWCLQQVAQARVRTHWGRRDVFACVPGPAHQRVGAGAKGKEPHARALETARAWRARARRCLSHPSLMLRRRRSRSGARSACARRCTARTLSRATEWPAAMPTATPTASAQCARCRPYYRAGGPSPSGRCAGARGASRRASTAS